jgi:hypothetical protein
MIVCFTFAKWSKPVECEIEVPPDREIIFRFVGGRVDGLEVTSLHRAEAESIWVLTHGGFVGQEFRLIATPATAGLGAVASLRRHLYRVVARTDSDTRIIITSHFVPQRTRCMNFAPHD